MSPKPDGGPLGTGGAEAIAGGRGALVRTEPAPAPLDEPPALPATAGADLSSVCTSNKLVVIKWY